MNLAEKIRFAADFKLGQGCGGRSCVALAVAGAKPRYYDGLPMDWVHDEFGVPYDNAFDEFPAGPIRQSVRHAWLYMLAQYCEEENIE